MNAEEKEENIMIEINICAFYSALQILCKDAHAFFHLAKKSQKLQLHKILYI